MRLQITEETIRLSPMERLSGQYTPPAVATGNALTALLVENALGRPVSMPRLLTFIGSAFLLGCILTYSRSLSAQMAAAAHLEEWGRTGAPAWPTESNGSIET